MSSPQRLCINGGVIAVLLVCFVLLIHLSQPADPQSAYSQSQQSANVLLAASSTTTWNATTTPSSVASAYASTDGNKTAGQSAALHAQESVVSQAARISNPYPSEQASIENATGQTRAALVNILCHSSGSIPSISGSGVFIDSRGVILTNAHIAQYVLLSEDPSFRVSCEMRAGSPARNAWKAAVLYIPPVWVSSHAHDIKSSRPLGTGEHDYALLYITETAGGSPRPAAFPSLPVDTREAIGFAGDHVLAAGYPAALVSNFGSLFAAISPSTIQTLLTFGDGSVDLMSVGPTSEAQSGSSGGAIVNPWERLIGTIVTTSADATYQLRALTLAYINRDLEAQTGSDLSTFLSGDLTAKLQAFNNTSLNSLLEQYRNYVH